MSGRLGYLWRIFKPHRPTPESIPLGRQSFTMPDDPLTLHPAAKRIVTICNLYANQNKSVEEIAGLLETKTSLVISGLIKGGVIADRRQSNQRVTRPKKDSQIPLAFDPADRQSGLLDSPLWTGVCRNRQRVYFSRSGQKRRALRRVFSSTRPMRAQHRLGLWAGGKLQVLTRDLAGEQETMIDPRNCSLVSTNALCVGFLLARSPARSGCG